MLEVSEVLDVVLQVLETALYMLEVVYGVRYVPWVSAYCSVCRSVFWRLRRAISVC